MKFKVKGTTVEIFVKRAYWLAWQSCGNPQSMGVFQDFPEANEDQVWENVVKRGDYPANFNKQGDYYGDYVFGRMMKLGFKVDTNGVIETSDSEYSVDYQSFAIKYPICHSLINAVVEDLGCSIEVID